MVEEREPPEDTVDQSNDAWFKENYLDLVQQYPRQWIAVLHRQVICNAARRPRAEAEARKIAGHREFSLYFVEPTALPL